MQRILTHLEFKNWKGLYTKAAEDILSPLHLRKAKNVDFGVSYGSISKIRGNKRLFATQYTESSTPQPISWVGFYKAPDLNGAILRKVLLACGTILAVYDPSTSAPGTALATGRASGCPHAAGMLGRILYIQNQDPKKVGVGNDPVKFDGVDIFKWGVDAPGTQETAVSGSETSSNWAATNGTIGTSTTNSLDGSSITLSKTSTGANYASAHLTGVSFSIPTTANRGAISIYIPKGLLHKLRQSGGPSIRILIGSHAANLGVDKTWAYAYSIGSLVEGWNFLKIDAQTTSTSYRTIITDAPNAAAIIEVKVEIYTNSNSVTFSGVAIDKLLTYDTGVLTATAGDAAAGDPKLNGDYSYRVTFVSKFGVESNAGPASPVLSTTNLDTIDLTNIPVSSDPQVIARRIYRTPGGGTVPLRFAQIDDNYTTAYEDSTMDVALSEKTPPFAGDASFDSSPPPRASVLRIWKDTVFLAGNPINPYTVFFSEPGEPELFPLLNQKDLDGPITAAYETYSSLIIETSTGKWQVTGDGPDFNFDKVVEGMGTVGPRGAGTSRIMGWTIDRDGLRLYDSSATPFKASEVIRDKYDVLNKTNIGLTHSGHSRTKNILLQFFPNASSVFDTVFQYQYIADNIQQGYWSTLELPAGVNILDTEEIEDENGELHLYAGSSGGMLYELYEPATKSFYTDASTTPVAITTEFQSPWMRVGELLQTPNGPNGTGRSKPRMVELRTKGDACTWNVTIESSEGQASTVVLDSKTIPMVFESGTSLKRIPILYDFVPGEYFRVTVSNSEAGVDSTVLACRIVFLPPEAGRYAVE